MDTEARILDVQTEIAAARERGAARVAALNASVKRELDRRDQEKKDTFAEWLMQCDVPAWAHQYAIQSDYDSAQFTIEFPGCALIYHNADGFHVGKATGIAWGEWEDDQWHVKTQRAFLMESRSWDEAIFLASEFGGAYVDMTREAAIRNANGDKPAPTPTVADQRLQSALQTDPADHVLAAIDGLDEGSAGNLWAALMIGTELRGIRTAVEDIAAALLALVPDDEVSE